MYQLGATASRAIERPGCGGWAVGVTGGPSVRRRGTKERSRRLRARPAGRLVGATQVRVGEAHRLIGVTSLDRAGDLAVLADELDQATPIFTQIAERLADEIAEGGLAEGDRVPSTNELAAFYRIDPAAAAKGIDVLIDHGLVEKRRGDRHVRGRRSRDRLLEDRRRRCRALRRADGGRGQPSRARRRRRDRAGSRVQPRSGSVRADDANDLADRSEPPLSRPAGARRHHSRHRRAVDHRSAGPQRRGPGALLASSPRRSSPQPAGCAVLGAEPGRKWRDPPADRVSSARTRPSPSSGSGHALRAASWFSPELGRGARPGAGRGFRAPAEPVGPEALPRDALLR